MSETHSVKTDPVAADAMRAARRRWASGVTVVVAADGEGGFRGVTVSAFTVVSLDPPLILVCLDQDGSLSPLIVESEGFAASVLDRRHEFLADRFAGRGPVVDARFGGVRHFLAPSGLPILDGALAWFDCRLETVHDGGDHVILLGAVAAAAIGPESDDPLLYFEGTYRSLEAE